MSTRAPKDRQVSPAWLLAAPWPLVVAAIVSCSTASQGPGDRRLLCAQRKRTGGHRHLAPPPSNCNGHAALCDRNFLEVSYPGTHGSYSNVDEHFGAPDQTHDIARQLADGIRVLHLEVHDDHGETVVCHSLCIIGERPLTHDLGAVQDFLSGSPDNVVTLLLERSDSTITADAIRRRLRQGGLVFGRPRPETWRSMAETVGDDPRAAAGRRLPRRHQRQPSSLPPPEVDLHLGDAVGQREAGGLRALRRRPRQEGQRRLRGGHLFGRSAHPERGPCSARQLRSVLDRPHSSRVENRRPPVRTS